MKALIKKELCNPINGELVGPYYHIYSISDDGKEEKIGTIDGNIEEAARLAERKIDLHELEVSYNENPDCFKSIISIPETSKITPTVDAIENLKKKIHVEGGTIYSSSL